MASQNQGGKASGGAVAGSGAAAGPKEPIVHQQFKGIVKQISSGDCIVIRNAQAKDGKYLEKTVMLSHISAARLARRAEEQEQPYAFEAREFLRTKLIGKEVTFVQEARTKTNDIDIGTLYLGRDMNGENINEAIIEAGLAEVRRFKSTDEENKMIALEDLAKSQGKGRWSKSPESEHVRNIKWNIENPTNFVDSFHNKPVNAIIEYVKDGSTVRALLLPSYTMVTVQLSGIKCPTFKRTDDNKEVAEPFAEEARQFVESRLLHRDIKIILEGVANQANGILLGTVLHPNGNISEFLLKDGLARCVDWSMGVVSQGSDKYRLAEKAAKQAKLRLWKTYQPSNSGLDEANKAFQGKVVEVGNGDSLTVRLQDGTHKKIFLSSIRPPRAADLNKDGAPAPVRIDKKNVPLYDVPYLFEAREFLRKKLIGKKISCHVDYVQPKSEDYGEKVCCTVTVGEINVAEALVSNGLARVIRYRQDDDQRSSKYDDLLAAEARAQKKGAGLHSTKEYVTMKIADASSDANRAKQFLPSLTRLGRVDAQVEFVSSGSRLKLYLPKESCLMTFILAGVDCPRYGVRPAPAAGTPAAAAAAAPVADEFGEDAYLFTKERCLQHEVRVEIENVDKYGNFIGWLFTEDNTNLSVGLVEAGFAGVFRNADRSPYFAQLSSAEHRAKEKKLNRWKNFVEEKQVVEETEKNEPAERHVNETRVVVTEITNELHFYAQHVDDGPKLVQLTNLLRSELAQRPPVPGAYTPKAGELCCAQFTEDDEWYRAKVVKVDGNKVHLMYIDYGNQEVTVPTKLAQIPTAFTSLPGQAHEYGLALVQLPKDEDYAEAALEQFKSEIRSDAEYLVNKEYRVGTVEFVTLFTLDREDLGKSLISNGHALTERRRERRLNKLVNDYYKSQDSAKASRLNLWRYGDITEDDAPEFGRK